LAEFGDDHLLPLNSALNGADLMNMTGQGGTQSDATTEGTPQQ
jgi:hypothetical protein